MINLSENQPLLMPHGQHKGKPLSRLPLFYLKWLAKNWSDLNIRAAAQQVIEHRQRLGIPEKPKKGGKSLEKQAEIPLQDDRIAKAKPEIVSFLGSNAVPEGQDLF